MQMTELTGSKPDPEVSQGGVVDHKKINKILMSHVTEAKVYLEPLESKSRFGKDKHAAIRETDDR